jgi:heat shock transcription factor 1
MPKFLFKTYDILENPEMNDCIKWSEDGTKLIIVDTKAFESKVLPVYFKHSNFSSFVRQLNMYDFHKIKSGSNQWLYQHRLFVRDRKEQLSLIKKKRGDARQAVVPSSLQESVTGLMQARVGLDSLRVESASPEQLLRAKHKLT